MIDLIDLNDRRLNIMSKTVITGNTKKSLISLILTAAFVFAAAFSFAPAVCAEESAGDTEESEYSVWFVEPAGFNDEVEALMKGMSADEGGDPVDELRERHTKALAEICGKYNAEYVEMIDPYVSSTVWVSDYVLNVHVKAAPSAAEEIGKLGFVESVRLADNDHAVSENAFALITGDIDMDGDVTPGDARLSLRYAVRLDVPDALQSFAADFDCDGKLTASDARDILRYSLGI